MELHRSWIRTIASLLAAVGTAYLLVKYLLPWLAPFAAALALAALMEPAVSRMCRGGWRRSAAAGFMTALLLAILGAAAVLLTQRAALALGELASGLPDFLSRMDGTLSDMKARAETLTQGTEASHYIAAALDSVGEAVYKLPGEASGWLLAKAAEAAGHGPGILLFAAACGIGTYFTSAAFPDIKRFARAQLPPAAREKLSGAGRNMAATLGGWAKAQLIMLAITFAELTAALLLLRVKNAVGIAALTSLVDALPVFGAGAVLVPWGIYAVLAGNAALGAGLIITSVVVSLVRSCAQAKLLGDEIGLHPLVSLIAMYAGWRIWGVWGMLLFPLAAVTLKQLNDKGVVRLWKPAD
jgi:sporulation integral membrane protein YtvI